MCVQDQTEWWKYNSPRRPAAILHGNRFLSRPVSIFTRFRRRHRREKRERWPQDKKRRASLLAFCHQNQRSTSGSLNPKHAARRFLCEKIIYNNNNDIFYSQNANAGWHLNVRTYKRERWYQQHEENGKKCHSVTRRRDLFGASHRGVLSPKRRPNIPGPDAI